MPSGRIPWLSWIFFAALLPAQQSLTPVPRGPIHVEGNRLIDSQGRVFLIRGTQLPEFRVSASPLPYSSTVFSTIRQRWNINAVRLPLNIADAESDPRYWRRVADVVRRANELELLVILTARGPTSFWRTCATFFRNYPHVMFDLGAGAPELIQAVRAAGARQTVLAADIATGDANVVHTVDSHRGRWFERLAKDAPILAADLDPHLEKNSVDCAQLPSDPTAAESLIQADLDYFDALGISWLASEFRPGKLIGDYGDMVATSLEGGWHCGQSADAPYGIGEVVQFHLWGGELRGLFAVNAAGNFTLPRGGIAIVYGGIFAERDIRSKRIPPPTELGGVSIRITDSSGIAQNAAMLYAAAGWGQANFVVPSGCAPGAARVTVARRDGTSSSTPVVIADVAPGFWTATANGRGPVIGFAPGDTPLSRCGPHGCSTVPIRPSAAAPTPVRLMGTGFRYASLADVQVRIGRIRVPVTALSSTASPGMDQVTVQIPPALGGMGETDLVSSVRGRLSNVVRIHIGAVTRQP